MKNSWFGRNDGPPRIGHPLEVGGVGEAGRPVPSCREVMSVHQRTADEEEDASCGTPTTARQQGIVTIVALPCWRAGARGGDRSGVPQLGSSSSSAVR